MADSSNTVAYTVENRIAWLKFNRPEKRNCMSPTLNRAMYAALDELEYRDDVGVLVLSGEGTAWSAGMDLKEYFRETEAQGLRAIRQSQREAYTWWKRLRWFQKPTIAMVNGWCFGGGYAPLFGCDLAYAADDAKFGLSEINWGILPGGGATKVARELLSFRRAMYHALTGEPIDASTALAWGLVNRVAAAAALDDEVRRFTDIILARSPATIALGKRAFYAQLDQGLAPAYALASETMTCNMQLDDAAEGMDAFLEKRPANWRGR